MLFVVPIVNGCGAQPQQTEAHNTIVEPKTDNMGLLEDVQYVHYHIGTGANQICLRFIRFKYNGHYYIMKDQNEGIMFHSPDCDCLNSSVGASSLLTTPLSNSSSLFEW
jgi:hypothetical protein